MTHKSYRYPLFNHNGKLIGYWYLRKESQYILTYRYMNIPHTCIQKDTDTEITYEFFQSFIQYLDTIYKKCQQNLVQLPKYEYQKAGFRPGWLKKLKRQAEEDYVQFPNVARKTLSNVISDLTTRGWPSINLPKIPWEEFNADKVFAISTNSAAYRELLRGIGDEKGKTDSGVSEHWVPSSKMDISVIRI